MIVTRCGYGFAGCVPPTDDERLQAYARALARPLVLDLQTGEYVANRYRPHEVARRGTDGLALVPRLRALWRRVDRLKRKAKPRKSAAKKSTVVPFRRRA